MLDRNATRWQVSQSSMNSYPMGQLGTMSNGLKNIPFPMFL